MSDARLFRCCVVVSLLSLAPAAWAETHVYWQETDTEKIKIKEVDGVVVGRWVFPKDAAGQGSGSGALPGARTAATAAVAAGAAGNRWSTPGGELTFVLPAGWTAQAGEQQDSLVIRFQLPAGSGEAYGLTAQAGRLAPNEAGQPIKVLGPLGLQQVQQSFPHLQPGALEYWTMGSGTEAASVLLSGQNPATGQAVKLWGALGVQGGFYLKAFLEGLAGPGFDRRLAEARAMFTTMTAQAPQRNQQAEAGLVGRWRCQYEGNYGVYVEVYTFAADGRWALGENSDFYFTGTKAGELGYKAGPGGGTGESGNGGTYQIEGSTLVLTSSDGTSKSHQVQLGPGELVMGGKRFLRIR